MYVLPSHIDQIPEIISTFVDLKVLKCLGLIINASQLVNCPSIESLELYGPAMTQLTSLQSLKSLKTGDERPSPPNKTLNIYNLVNLINLVCKGANISSINNIGVNMLNNFILESIELHNVPIQDFNIIYSQSALKELKIINTIAYGNWYEQEYDNLPEPLTIANLIQLLSLELVKFGTLPANIAGCANLTTLKLNNINQREIPAHIFNMTNLREIDFSNCEIHNPFEHLTLTNTSIRIIILDDSFVTTISPNVVNLSRLEYISAKNNLIATIPNELFTLPNLREVVLNNNLISNLPSNVPLLYRLELLDNKITKLLHKVYANVSKFALLDSVVHANNSIVQYTQSGKRLVKYPSFMIDKVYDILEYLEPFVIPSDINIDFDELIAENVDARMVYVAFINMSPGKKDEFLSVFAEQTNPYLAILSLI
jgi:Leucine-rich repeat (LRR) protein